MDTRALDRWITREPDWDDAPPRLRCAACGRFLAAEAYGQREWVNVRRCNGEPHVIAAHYGDHPQDDGILSIIGEERRGEMYRVAYPADCGSRDGSTHRTHDGEVDPDRAAEWRHAPHYYADDFDGYTIAAIRVCWCGHVNEDVLT